MATDPKAKEITIPLPVGFFNLTRGLAEALFGTDLQGLETSAVNKTVSVKGHSRTRVIGGPSTSVSGYSYTFKKYPTGRTEVAEGGQPVMVDLGNGDKWTVRVHAPLNVFADFLEKHVKNQNVFMVSQRGTVYGPFITNQN